MTTMTEVVGVKLKACVLVKHWVADVPQSPAPQSLRQILQQRDIWISNKQTEVFGTLFSHSK